MLVGLVLIDCWLIWLFVWLQLGYYVWFAGLVVLPVVGLSFLGLMVMSWFAFGCSLGFDVDFVWLVFVLLCFDYLLLDLIVCLCL